MSETRSMGTALTRDGTVTSKRLDLDLHVKVALFSNCWTGVKLPSVFRDRGTWTS